MLQRLLILLLTFFGTTTWATPKEDAAFFLDHFVEEQTWAAKQSSFHKHSAGYYRTAFGEKNVIILDPERFQNALSDQAAVDAIEVLKSDLSSFIINSYSPAYLAEIAAFFRTPTGESMLAIAKKERLFFRLHTQSNHRGPIQRWPQYLSRLDRARYQTFTNTPAGRFFVTRTWAVRKDIYYRLSMRSRWPKMPLNRSYIIDILMQDGIFKYPNRTSRAALFRELRADLP